MPDLRPKTHPNLRRVLRLTLGFVLLPVGTVLLVLPGPGVPVLLVALGLLASDFAWAQRTLLWLRRGVARAMRLGPRRNA